MVSIIIFKIVSRRSIRSCVGRLRPTISSTIASSLSWISEPFTVAMTGSAEACSARAISVAPRLAARQATTKCVRMASDLRIMKLDTSIL
uniref:hypothetical protein n=1 Tax=Bradyrhizobium sp. (strain ORS 278) TaxID=114615 RepID=UPI001FCAF62C|nr:hypothetical protein [Bradyrhizobium sp. ORS 278]